MYKYLVLLTLISAAICSDCVRLNFLPMPKNVTCDPDVNKSRVFQDPCRILYHVKTPQKETAHFQELIKDQNHKTFNCKITNLIFGDISNLQLVGFEYTLTIQVKDYQLKSAFNQKDQAYNLSVTEQNSSLQANTYVGFVRGLETFLQTFQCPKFKYKKCVQKRLPLHIQDEPAFVYRGVMVDTSRHFLPTHLLFETIDALMYNKMNVFHWHITDQDAFPLILDSHPQIAQYAAFSPQQTYTSKEARQIVRYAMIRGVRVIPQLDTPGHAASWGLAPQNQGVACTFGTGYMGPLDVSLQKTYKLVKQVFAEIIDIFPDPIIHLGGDQVVLTCLANKTQFVKAEGIKQQQIQRHYRRKQHKIIKQLNKDKTPMYWFNGNIQVQDGDIVHWWGGGMPRTKNPVVISNYGPFYLDMGVGNYYAVSYGQYVTWLDLYNQNIDRMISSYDNKANVLGAQVTLWSQINNRYTHHMKIWIRSSAIAQRLWNVQNFNPKPDFFGRITAFQRLMNRRGIPTAPGTCEQCETHPQFC